jgi:hypothetical protein
VLLAEKMNLLPEVAWDRWGGWYEYPGDEGISAATVFGWIARDDGRSDFVTLAGFWTQEQGLYHFSFNTSSARYSHEFAKRMGIDGHRDCRRIEDDFGPLVDRKVEVPA